MFRFSANQRHALEHGLQDFGKLTLAVLFLGSSLGFMPLKPQHPSSDAAFSNKAQHQAKSMGTGLSRHLGLLHSCFE